MTTEHSDTIELGQVARTIARGWRAAVGFTALGVGLAIAVILFAPRKYTGVGTIVIKAGGGSASGGSSILSQVTGLGDISSGLLGAKSQMETEIEILSSRAVVGEVVDSLFLQARMLQSSPIPTRQMLSSIDASGSFKRRRYLFSRTPQAATYRYEGADGPGQMTPGTPLRLPGATLTFAVGVLLPNSFAIELRDREDAIERVSKHLLVEKDKGEVASVTYRGDDSVTAASVPNLLLDTYLARRKGIDRGVNQRRVEFLSAKSDSMAGALARAARDLRKQQEASGVLDATAVARVGLESGAGLRAKLTEVLVEQGALQRLMTQVNAKTLNPRQLAAYPAFLKSPAVNNIVSQLADVETRRTVLLATRVETDPQVVALVRSAADLEAQLVPYATTYGAALEKERSDIEAAVSHIDDDLARLPQAAESAGQLQIHMLDLAKLSAGLQAQLVEAKLAAIGEGGDVHPLDLAVAPKKPSFPNPPITAGLGAIGGLLCGLIAALLVGSLGRWVRDPIEVERTTGVPALRFDPAVPLLLSGAASRTLVVAPIDAGIAVTPVVNRLMQTAASRSISAAVLTLAAAGTDVNGSIARLEAEYNLVIVHLPSLLSDSAAATLQHARPVLLVTAGDRIERRRLMGAVRMLKRLDVPCAGIVMSSGIAVNGPVANDRAILG